MNWRNWSFKGSEKTNILEVKEKRQSDTTSFEYMDALVSDLENVLSDNITPCYDGLRNFDMRLEAIEKKLLEINDNLYTELARIRSGR